MDSPRDSRVLESDKADITFCEARRDPVELAEIAAISSFRGFVCLDPVRWSVIPQSVSQGVRDMGGYVVGLGEGKKFEIGIRNVKVANEFTSFVHRGVGHTRECNFRKRVIYLESHLGVEPTPDGQTDGPAPRIRG